MTGPDDETKANIAKLRIAVDKTAARPNNPENDIFYNAFTSVEFQARVEAGLERVRQHRAESGFSILSNGQEIIYTPLDLGGQSPLDSEEKEVAFAFGMRPETHTGLGKMSQLDTTRALETQHQIIADLHFHPATAPFSDADIQAYDDIIASGGSAHGLAYRPDLYFGVFIPSQPEGNGNIPSLKLFMFAGPSGENFYQSEDFNRLRSPDKQREVLERSGMKVVLVELPTSNGRVNLEPLRSALK